MELQVWNLSFGKPLSHMLWKVEQTTATRVFLEECHVLLTWTSRIFTNRYCTEHFQTSRLILKSEDLLWGHQHFFNCAHVDCQLGPVLPNPVIMELGLLLTTILHHHWYVIGSSCRNASSFGTWSGLSFWFPTVLLYGPPQSICNYWGSNTEVIPWKHCERSSLP